MYHIPEMTSDNLGGIAELFFTDQDNIAQFPFINDLAASEPVILKPGKIWYSLKFTVGSAGHSEEPSLTEHGTLYDHEIEGFHAKDSQQVGLAYAAMAGRKLILLTKDQNGTSRLFGNTEDFLLVTRKSSSGKAPADRNGTNFSFKGKSSQPAIYYLPATPANDLPGAGSGADGFVTIVNRLGQVIATVPSGGAFEINSGFTFGFRIL
ncbi:MAG: hypothetical protein ACO1OF_16380 [Adhaeribacter sp.]